MKKIVLIVLLVILLGAVIVEAQSSSNVTLFFDSVSRASYLYSTYAAFNGTFFVNEHGNFTWIIEDLERMRLNRLGDLSLGSPNGVTHARADIWTDHGHALDLHVGDGSYDAIRLFNSTYSRDDSHYLAEYYVRDNGEHWLILHENKKYEITDHVGTPLFTVDPAAGHSCIAVAGTLYYIDSVSMGVPHMSAC